VSAADTNSESRIQRVACLRDRSIAIGAAFVEDRVPDNLRRRVNERWLLVYTWFPPAQSGDRTLSLPRSLSSTSTTVAGQLVGRSVGVGRGHRLTDCCGELLQQLYRDRPGWFVGR